jgi:hypothetical protein
MAYTTIDDPSAHFQTALYTGDGNSTQAITNDGNSDLQPDWIWTKQRSHSVGSNLTDSSRGASKALFSESTDAEDTGGNISSFDSDGFTTTNANRTNQSGRTFAAWQWKANGGTRTTFTESGSNPGGGRQVNTTAGFSIIDYTGTGSAGTIAHGLGAVPSLIMCKGREHVGGWIIYHHRNTSAPETDILELQSTAATYDSSTYWNDTAPTSSVFTVNTSNDTNKDGAGLIAYVFTEIQGYSRFGSYKGNGSSDGALIYTGFKPAWLLFKESGAAGENWRIFDNKRSPSNQVGAHLFASTNSAESSETGCDFLSNGFKWRNSDAHQNGNGKTYIYWAFAEHPFVSSKGAPVTAR